MYWFNQKQFLVNTPPKHSTNTSTSITTYKKRRLLTTSQGPGLIVNRHLIKNATIQFSYLIFRAISPTSEKPTPINILARIHKVSPFKSIHYFHNNIPKRQ